MRFKHKASLRCCCFAAAVLLASACSEEPPIQGWGAGITDESRELVIGPDFGIAVLPEQYQLSLKSSSSGTELSIKDLSRSYVFETLGLHVFNVETQTFNRLQGFEEQDIEAFRRMMLNDSLTIEALEIRYPEIKAVHWQ